MTQTKRRPSPVARVAEIEKQLELAKIRARRDLKHSRTVLGLSLEDAGELIGMSKQAVRGLESHSWSTATCAALEHAYRTRKENGR